MRPAMNQQSRGWSAQWSRLKPAPVDFLQDFGLPSKGETRLNDFRTQEVFYSKIVERYLKFCAASPDPQQLSQQFSAISLQTSRWATPQTAKATSVTASPSAGPHPSSSQIVDAARNASTITKNGTLEASPELLTIFAAMRKLREALVATRRRDNFAQRVEIFIVRAAILAKAWEQYHPALFHLLKNIHPLQPLSTPELQEFAGYWVLDLGCRQNDLNGAHKVRLEYDVKDYKVGTILRSLVNGSWVQYHDIQRKVDGYQRALMEFAAETVGNHALQCLSRTYFTVEKSFVENAAGMSWSRLTADSKVRWDTSADGGSVIIRRQKAAH